MTRLITLLLLCACEDPLSDFTCRSDAACVSVEGASGRCEPDGYCSFGDSSCDSGRRYAVHSGAASGECVFPSTQTNLSKPDMSLHTNNGHHDGGD